MHANSYSIDISADSNFDDFLDGYESYKINYDKDPVSNFQNSSEVEVSGDILSLTITKLLGGTVYYYRVRAHNNEANSDYSDTNDVLTTPPVPLSLPATNVGLYGFDANWVLLEGISDYEVTIYNYEGNKKKTIFSVIRDFSSANATIGTFQTGEFANTTGETFYYYVRSVIEKDGIKKKSLPSALIILSTKIVNLGSNSPLVCNPPTNIETDKFTINWDHYYNASGLSGFYIEVSRDIDFTDLISFTNEDNPYKQIDNIEDSSAIIDGLEEGNRYYYRMQFRTSSNLGGPTLSTYSNIVTVRTLLPPPILEESIGIRSHSFVSNWKWDDEDDSKAIQYEDATLFYELHLSTNEDLKDSLIYKTNSLLYRIAGLEAGETYYYKVRAFSDEGYSSFSDPKFTTLIPAAPVLIVDNNPTDTSFIARWMPAKGAGSYRLQVSYDINFNRLVGDDTISSTFSVLVNDLVAGYGYYYRVWSRPTSGSNVESDNYSSARQVTRPLPPLALEPATVYGTGFIALWQGRSAVDVFLLDVATDRLFSDTSFIYKDVFAYTFSYIVSDLVTNELYYYRVRSSSGNIVSANSNTIEVKTVLPPPDLLKVDISFTGGFTIYWSNVKEADGYELNVSKDVDFEDYDIFNLDKITNYKVEGLDDNTYYYYRLRSFLLEEDPIILSEWSIIGGALTSPSVPVLNLVRNITSTSFLISWNNVPRASHYDIDVSLDEDFVTTLSDYTNIRVYANSVVIGGLDNGLKYYYRVRSRNGSSSSNYNSNFSSTLILDAPMLLSPIDITISSFLARWNSVDLADNYALQLAEDTSILEEGDVFITGLGSLKIEGLSDSTIYYYRVRSQSESLGNSPYSQFKEVMTLAIPVEEPPITAIYSNIGELSIYPNPVTNYLSVKSNSIILHYKLIDAEARIIDDVFCETQYLTIEMRYLKPGIYYLTINSKDGIDRTYKILKN